jgi:predicted dienelactone hydrolase
MERLTSARTAVMWPYCLAFAQNRGENWRMDREGAPIVKRNFLRLVRRRAVVARIAAVVCALLTAWPAATLAQGARGGTTFPVGIKQLDYIDSHEGGRHLTLAVFYPAVIRERSATPFAMPFFTNLNLFKDAEPAFDGSKHPLVVFSHGRGSNGLYYAWFAEFLASHGYIVAALNHYRANTYDSTIAYLANKLWRRPRDVGLVISFLLDDPFWGKSIDASRIGVAGHSQGGFTALWVGGAQINPEKYLAFQRGWRNNQMVPEYLRNELPLDASPALGVGDKRVKAVLAMAPGIVQTFGMDEGGLRQLTVPTYITVGEGDTQAPPKDNAEFAARHIAQAELHVIPGRVDHDIFINECNEDGRNEFPQACIDAPGVDRRGIHASIGDAALKFYDASLKVPRGK